MQEAHRGGGLHWLMRFYRIVDYIQGTRMEIWNRDTLFGKTMTQI